MKRRRSRFITILFLSLFCGQLLAAPFLNCCIGMQHDAAGDYSKGKAHAHMTMENQTKLVSLTTIGNSGHSSMAGMANDMADDMANAMAMDCDHRCDLCLVGCAALLPESENMITDIKAGLAIVLPRTPSLQSLTDNPFRPPIHA